MITVKLLGGARKSFSSDKLEIYIDLLTVSDLLDYLEKNTLENAQFLDLNNILVAINGVDSSALEGKKTLLKNGDIVSIIPLVHGGQFGRIKFVIMKNMVELVRLKIVAEPIEFIESLRNRCPGLIIQGIGVQYVLNVEHAKKIVSISLYAQSAGTLLSNKIETDILMRFANTRQISDAISKVGVKKHTESMLILIGKQSDLNKIFKEMGDLLQNNVFSKDHSRSIMKEFGITKKEIATVFSTSPLEDLLAERAATLFH